MKDISAQIGMKGVATFAVMDRTAPAILIAAAAAQEESPLRRKILVSRERLAWRSDDGIEVLPVYHFLRRLWAGDICG